MEGDLYLLFSEVEVIATLACAGMTSSWPPAAAWTWTSSALPPSQVRAEFARVLHHTTAA